METLHWKPCNAFEVRKILYLQHLHLHCRDSILNPLADFRVPALPHWMVIFPGLEKRRLWVDVSFIEDGVDRDD